MRVQAIEPIADASGNGNTGALTGGVTWSTAGPTGHSLAFDGSSGDVSFPTSSTLNPPSFTTAAWANWAGGGGDYQNVAASILINTGGWYILRDIDGVWHAFLYGGSSYADLPGPTAVSREWIHLALTYDQTSGTATFYVNGITVGSQSFPAFVPNTTAPWHIGCSWDGTETNYFLDGSVADVRLYDRALSADEIAGLYNLSPPARVSYTANWFDGVDRPIASANYGAIDSFTRPDTPPSSSSTVLVTSMSYNEAGQPSQVTDPMGYVKQTSYDAAGRTTQTVEAYGSGSDRTTNYTYTLDNLIETLTAVNSTTGDQTTTYAYGTTLSDSGVARNDLLISVTYPDSVSDSDVVSYAYNRLGQQATITDQRGTIRTFYYDKLGRLTDDCVTTVGDDTDNTVLRITTSYEVRGMIQTVTSYDNATPGSGTALNQCAISYNSFAQLTEEQQAHSGTVSASTPSVAYTYASGATGSNQIRLLSITYPNGRVVAYGYGISGQIDDRLNRVYALLSDGAVITQYTYVGGGA